MPIVECVPNFSEGKNKKVIQAIKNSIAKISGIKVLDIHMDPDHNRSVISFIGEPDQAIKAAFEAVKKAAQLIDLTKHKGEHPRIGATDVVPLIPLEGITYKECIKLAEKLGKKIGEELKIPVYLYEKAATKFERKNLANLRKGGYERLKNEIKKPYRKPDFGPSKLSKAGVTAVSVRPVLIAFNVNLKTNDLKIAKYIAKKLREKNGGLPAVKALAISLKSKNIVQVSMNLTNYIVTPPLKAFKKVEKEAKKFGIKISESEIVGLVPKDALPKNPKKSLKLKKLKYLQKFSKSV
ncbi:glutamate formimidoyltransferase [Candidatus Peregrinibacteria bacterium]|nr:glutamate formimidoyltransferase [Candidatus Peregrinibacteria bacterium]